jgi:hypothetical protein
MTASDLDTNTKRTWPQACDPAASDAVKPGDNGGSENLALQR